MSHNLGDAATTAREQEPEQTQTPSAEQNAQGAQPATSGQTNVDAATAISESPAEPTQSTGTPSPETPVQSAASPATPQPTGDPDEGVANSANVAATTPAQEATRAEFAPRPDVSDQDWQQLVPKLLALFNNNREQLGRALGLHRSTVDRWLNGKSRPNTSTILRMRRLAQERNVE